MRKCAICGQPTIIVHLKDGKPYCMTCINIAPTPAKVERAHGLGVRLDGESSEEKSQRSYPQSDLLSPDDKAFLKEAHVDVADDATSVEKISSLDGQYCEAHGQFFGPKHRCAVILVRARHLPATGTEGWNKYQDEFRYDVTNPVSWTEQIHMPTEWDIRDADPSRPDVIEADKGPADPPIIIEKVPND